MHDGHIKNIMYGNAYTIHNINNFNIIIITINCAVRYALK